MKPLQIIMQAFGSYGAKQTVDLTKCKQNLFLVTGKTGSGKTTIFDAMVFALYGEASSVSNKKDGAELQSQFATYDVEPFVELTFSEAGEKYTVRRSPQHIQTKKRGTGERKVRETVSLTLPNGLPYPEKETNEKLVELVGLTKSQFMQIAMIAQGEFMEVLRSDTNKKKEIFRKLFHTELYEKIVNELKDRYDEKRSEMDQMRADFRAKVSQIIVPEDAEGGEALSELKHRIAVSKDISVVDMEELQKQLELLCAELKANSEEAENQKKQTSRDRDAVKTLLTEAETLKTSFEQLEQAKKELAECQDSKADMAEKDILRGQIDRAYEVQSAWKLYDAAQNALSATEQQLKEEEGHLPELQAAYAEENQRETALKEAESKEISHYSQVKEKVEQARETFANLRDTERDIAYWAEQKEESEKEEKTVTEQLSQLNENESAWKQEEATLSDTPVRRENWKNRNAEMEALSKEVSELQTVAENLKKQEMHCQKLTQEYETARNKYERQRKEYDALQLAFYDAQAGLLARDKLKSNEPCPVCGSIHHPNPCRLAEEHQNLSQQDLKSMGKTVEQLRTDMVGKSNSASSEHGSLKQAKGNAVTMLSTLRGRMADSLEGIPDELTIEDAEGKLSDYRTQLQTEDESLKTDEEQLKELQKQLSKVSETREQLNQELTDLQKKTAEAKEAHAAAVARLESLNSQRNFETLDEAEAELKTAETKKKLAEEKHRESKTKAEDAKEAVDRATAIINDCEEKLPEQRERTERESAAYAQALKDAKLTETEWQEVVKEHSKDESNDLKKEIDDWNRKKSQAETAKRTAAETIGNREKPDLEALQTECDEKQKLYDQAENRWQNIHDQYRTNDRVLNQLTPEMKRRTEAMAEYSCLERLYRRLAGKNTGSRMDLETFVQRYYLERILQLANHRFLDMSAGQYELRLTGIESAGEGKNHGLDLMVYSTVTGMVREIRTLSGGESFMAALSLALGMADQIQMSSSQVHLDMMFIDEGFGSLDDQSRSQAVRVLKQMAGGSRLIGIISHVSELKQEIDEQLVVTKDEHGSRAVWQLG